MNKIFTIILLLFITFCAFSAEKELTQVDYFELQIIEKQISLAKGALGAGIGLSISGLTGGLLMATTWWTPIGYMFFFSPFALIAFSVVFTVCLLIGLPLWVTGGLMLKKAKLDKQLFMVRHGQDLQFGMSYKL
jgi:hypothetical protein